MFNPHINYDAEIARLEHQLEMAWIELGYTPECRKQMVQNRINSLMAEIAQLRMERLHMYD